MTSKRTRFFEEVERMKERYRKYSTQRLLEITKRPYAGIKAYKAAVRAVLAERGVKISN